MHESKKAKVEGSSQSQGLFIVKKGFKRKFLKINQEEKLFVNHDFFLGVRYFFKCLI